MEDGKKENKAKLKHVIENNVYLMKLICRIAPEVIIVTPILTVVYTIIGFFVGTYLLRYMINGYQTGISFVRIAVYIIVLYILQFVTQIIGDAYYSIRIHKISFKIESEMKKLLFCKAAEVELACFENAEFYDKYVKAMGEAVNRVNELVSTCSSVLSCVISLTANSFMIFLIDPVLMVFAFVPMILNLILGKKRNKIGYEYNMKMTEENRRRDYTRRTFYLADFAKEMRLTNIYRVMLKNFDDAVKNIFMYIHKYGFKLAAFDYIFHEAQDVISYMGASLYAIYSTLVLGKMMYGDCLIVINSISSISWVLQYSINILNKFHEHSLYIDNLRTFLDYKPKIADGDRRLDANKNSYNFQLKNVSFKYEGQKNNILKNINISVGENQKIALVGHNGAGKSTLVKLMLRLYDPTEGDVFFGDEKITDYTVESYREQFGVVFQDFKLFSMSVSDNVLLRRHKDGDSALTAEALKNSDIYEKIMSLNHKEETILTREFDDNGTVLSGGETQKVSIARIFARDCKIVLLDEPSSALDPIAEYNMYENMMKACEGRSVVFISHRLSSAVLADKIYMLENGEIIEEGSHHELMAQGGKYAKMFKHQAESYVGTTV